MNYLNLFEEYSFNTISIKNDGYVISWLYDNEKIGEFYYHISDNIAIIVGYRKDPNPKYKRLGLHYIKKSIEYLLQRYVAVFSPHNNRNKYSDVIWDKLKNHFVISNEIIDGEYGYMAKIQT